MHSHPSAKKPFSSLTPRTDAALAAKAEAARLAILCLALELELSEANAIKAELLEALKRVAGWLESFRAPVTTTEAEKVGVLAQIEQAIARAAIAKAEGK